MLTQVKSSVLANDAEIQSGSVVELYLKTREWDPVMELANMRQL